MEDKEFFEIFEKLTQEQKDDLLFKALGGKKKTSKYTVDTYYKGLGYYVGGWGYDKIDETLTKLGEVGLPSKNYHDLPIIKQAKEKHNVNYINTIYSGTGANPFIQFFVCNALDMRF